jgi:hypothetical protein
LQVPNGSGPRRVLGVSSGRQARHAGPLPSLKPQVHARMCPECRPRNPHLLVARGRPERVPRRCAALLWVLGFFPGMHFCYSPAASSRAVRAAAACDCTVATFCTHCEISSRCLALGTQGAMALLCLGRTHYMHCRMHLQPASHTHSAAPAPLGFLGKAEANQSNWPAHFMAVRCCVLFVIATGA